LTSSLDSLPEGRTLEDVDATRSIARLDACAHAASGSPRMSIAPRMKISIRLDIERSPPRARSTAVTLTVRAFEE